MANGSGRTGAAVGAGPNLAIRGERAGHLAARAGIGRSYFARAAVTLLICEERSDEVIKSATPDLDCFAALAMTKSGNKRYQVVIIGGGPVGVALAVELGQRGLSCALVERRREPQRIPKGQNLTQRSVEHFYFWGVLDALRGARILPPSYPMSGIVAYRDLNNDYWAAPPLREIVNPYYFQNNERLPQYQAEYVLRARLAQLKNVETRFGWAAQAIDQNADTIEVTIAEDGEAGREILRSDYAVGCDGPHSLVREQAGIARGGADFDQLMVLALFRSRELHEGLKRFPPRSTYRVIHPELKGYWQFFGRVDVGEGWFFRSPVPANTTRDNYD